MLLGLNNLQYATSPLAAVAIIMLDYVVAFSVLGLGGLFKNKLKDHTLAFSLGTILACALRYICHVISGCTVWAGVSIPDAAGLYYSLSYNSAYMIPETILTVIAAYTVSQVFDLTSYPMKRTIYQGKVGVVSLLEVSLAVMVDSMVLFMSIQNEGGYNIKNIVNANWRLILSVSLAAVVILTVDVIVKKKKNK
jgi:thiamine transporter